MNNIFKPKFFSVLKLGLNKKQLTSDILSGIVVGIVALPLAIAFAVASGVSPEKGIITAIVAGFLIALLGGSRVQIGGPTGAFMIIVYGIVTQFGMNGLIIATLMAGVLMIIFGLLKLGIIVKYIPCTITTGFTTGIAHVRMHRIGKIDRGRAIRQLNDSAFRREHVNLGREQIHLNVLDKLS